MAFSSKLKAKKRGYTSMASSDDTENRSRSFSQVFDILNGHLNAIQDLSKVIMGYAFETNLEFLDNLIARHKLQVAQLQEERRQLVESTGMCVCEICQSIVPEDEINECGSCGKNVCEDECWMGCRGVTGSYSHCESQHCTECEDCSGCDGLL